YLYGKALKINDFSLGSLEIRHALATKSPFFQQSTWAKINNRRRCSILLVKYGQSLRTCSGSLRREPPSGPSPRFARVPGEEFGARHSWWIDRAQWQPL